MIVEKNRPLPLEVSEYRSFRATPISGTIGAEIVGVDLNDLSDVAVSELQAAFSKYLVLCVRDQQNLTPENHIRFAQIFGRLQPIPHLNHIDGYEQIQIIHRDARDDRKVTGEVFHNDSTYMKTPPRAVAMRAVALPPYGGDTAFANLYLAYETLSETMKQIVDNLQIVHSAKRLFGSGADQARYNMKGMQAGDGDLETIHPLVLTHPETGRKSLFVNPVFVQRIHGMTDLESQPILEFLFRHCSFIPLTARVKWLPGTIVLWDNWHVHHSAIGDYEGYERTLHRVTVATGTPS